MSRRSIIVWIFASVMLAGIALESGGIDSWDTGNRLQVTRWIWMGEPQVANAEKNWYGVVGRNGEKFAWTGLGQSLWMLPAQFFGANLSEHVVPDGLLSKKLEEFLIVYLVFPLTSALAVVSIANLLMSLGFRESLAGLGALAGFWCTSLLPYTNINQENTLTLLCTATSLWAVVEGVKRSSLAWWALAGATAGFGVLTRLTLVFDSAVIFVFAASLAYVSCGGHPALLFRRYLPGLLTMAAAWGFFLIVERGYNFYRFDSWFTTYRDVMLAQRPELFPPADFFGGLYLLTLAPGGALWQFDPLVLVAVPALVIVWPYLNTPVRLFSSSILVLLLVYVLFHATDPWPLGTSAWGSRYTTTPVILLSAMAIPLVWCNRGPARVLLLQRLTPLVVIGALAVQILASIFWYQLEEAQRLEKLGASASMVVLRAQNVAALAMGSWEEWGLLPSGESIRMRTPNFFPFLLSKYLSPAAATAAKGVWAILLLAAVSLNVILCLRLRRDLFKDSDPGGNSPVS